MNDIQFTPHFKLSEFVRSETAEKRGIENNPSPEAVENLRLLSIHTLEPLREALGLPIVITSGYRCKALNDLIAHHSQRSQHMEGRAADFYVISRRNGGNGRNASHRELLIEAFRTIITSPEIDYDQLIIYPTFIHVSYVGSGKNRHKLMLGLNNGKYCALTHEAALELN